MKFLSLAFISFLSFFTFSQFTMESVDFNQSNPLDCSTIGGNPTNFTVNGNPIYPQNFNDTVVFCPDLAQGSKVSIAFAVNAGFTFDVDPTDSIYIFDGPDVNSPLLGVFNSGTNPTGFNVQASFDNNPSGCLTVVFVTDGADDGAGWNANVTCGNPPQPIVPHIEAFINGGTTNDLNPLDTGYVDVCLGDSILLVANPDFLYSLENAGTGYSQTNDNCTFQWTISGFGQFTGDSIWFTPPSRTGYYVELRVTDIFPQFEVISCRVRVSQQPIFIGAGPLEDSVCFGETTSLVGGVTVTDTAGVDIPGGTFQVGGSFAGLTALPDGSGLSYTTTIPISGFDAGATVTSASDFDSLLLSIEHSYLGDLEVFLECPNGTSLIVFDGFNGGGGGNYLGNDTGIDGGAPGSPQWDYSFSEQFATSGTLPNGGTIMNDYGFPSMDPAPIYSPEASFNGFIGCPLNGNWTITVTDNLGIDDGYIFEWAIFFNTSLYPDSEGYQNVVETEFWSSDPAIVGGEDDTLLLVNPPNTGDYSFTFNVVDDFGCAYDTTVSFFVIPQPVIFDDTIACNLTLEVSGTESFGGGVWTITDTALNIQPNVNVDNPLIYTSTTGTYTVSFTDNRCNTTVSSEVFFVPLVYTNIIDTNICNGSEYEYWADTINTPMDYLWNTGATSRRIIVTEPGEYSVTVSNVCHTYTDFGAIGLKECDILAPNVMTINGDGMNEFFQIDFNGLKKYKITITNRWGNKVFESDDPQEGWDGRNFGGNYVTEGTYFYTIDAKTEGDQDLIKQGFVQVIIDL